MTAQLLFSPLKVGPYQLSHRIVMPPLTRMRADKASAAPTALSAEYYAQRATKGGLLIAEASPVVATGRATTATPAIHSDVQVAGWRQVTDAVHEKGGVIFLQLWHVGRVSHSSFQPDGALPVGPSAVAVAPEDAMALTASGELAPYETPRALERIEIAGIVENFRQGAENAKRAGFDGVEIHAANGYLIEQFLYSSSNLRTDDYGGPIANRVRFLLEVTDAAIGVWGADRVGVRLSPWGIANGSSEADPIPLFTYVVGALNKLGLAYLHFMEPRSSGAGRAEVDHQNAPSAMRVFRQMWDGVLISTGGFDGPSGEAAVEAGYADAIGYGRHFISNPDLPERIRKGLPLASYNRPTFYTGDAAGYTDYPTYTEQQNAEQV